MTKSSLTPTAKRSTRSARRSEPSLNPIIGAAMIGILGGGPRLALRAARVVIQDGRSSRSRRSRLRGRVRHGGN
jgi:hypothetical protein